MALIDTGSDMSMLRASEYAMMRSPRMRAADKEFCGIGGFSARVLGEFRANMLISEHTYSILIRVAPDTVIPYDLIFGADLSIR